MQQDESVHCIGNGLVCSYLKGPTILQLFGPHYGVPSSLKMQPEFPYEKAVKTRLFGTAIWKQDLFADDEMLGSITDFADPTEPVFYRRIRFHSSSRWCIEPFDGLLIHLLPPLFNLNGKCFFGEIPAGQPFYTQSNYERFPRAAFVTDRPYFYAVYVSSELALGKTRSRLICTGNEGFMAFLFAESFEELIKLIRKTDAEEFSPDIQQRLSRRKWMNFTGRRRKNRQAVSEDMERVIDDIAVLIKTQQSQSGGVLAGYNYHLAYIRDNYGVMRGLLAMGCFDEAKKLILYYRTIFRQYGRIRNAQGTDSYAFHVHENDDVEITAYMVLMCLDYFLHTRDLKTLQTLIPLMNWCILRQHESVRGGMLSFNGDETYIAGGLIPRSVIYQGSMEVTMLYHAAISRLLDLDPQKEVLAKMPVDAMERDRETIERSFEKNFIRKGRITCNAPGYAKPEELPAYRNGVRLCGHGFGISFRRSDRTYVCVECALEDEDKTTVQSKEEPPVLYHSYSAVLMAIYVGSTLICSSVLDKERDRMLDQYIQTGTLSSEVIPGKMTGYDPGLLLFAIANQGNLQEKMIRQRLLDLQDRAGAYVEYYLDGKPSGTMCRPWESGINISALIGL
jgi:hypothetical protein